MKTGAHLVYFLVLVCCSFTLMAQGRPATPVNVVEARQTNIFPTSWVAGTVISNNDAQLAAEVSGRLVYVAQVGERVGKGQTLARIDKTMITLELEELQAIVDSAQYNFDHLSAEVKRKEGLAKKNLSSQNDLDETRNNRDMAKARLSQEKARLAAAKQRLAYTSMVAPFDGVVTKRLSNLGEVVSNGSKVIQLVETVNLEITAQVPLTVFQFLESGAELDVKSPLGNGKAKVKAVVPVADVRSHLMELRLALDETAWPVGLNVRVAVPSGLSTSQLVVPRDALVLRREGNVVFRINGENKAERIAVSLGVASGEMIAVEGELNVGDKIVIRGSERLQPGQTVAIKNNNDTLVSMQGN